MVTESKDSDDQEMPPPLDDSWWEAVLAEDNDNPNRTTGRIGARIAFDENRAAEDGNPHAADEINWDLANQTYELDQVIELEVVGYNRGGLLVKGEGLQGFVPLSHLLDIRCDQEEEFEACLQDYQNRTLRLKLIECESKSERIVFSERAALTEPGSRIELLNRLRSGDQVKGKVTNITGFGIFVDLGGVEGLVHVSEISWGRVQHPSDIVSIGQVIDVYVIQVDQTGHESRSALNS
jgi:small subunit ribosomal protein S1